MGMESDQEIVQMVGRDPKYAGILNPSLQVSYLLHESWLKVHMEELVRRD